MKKKNLSFLLIILRLGGVAQASDATDVRNTVQSVFEQLKSHDYSGLYDRLPGSSRNRMSRDRFVNALQRAQDFYQLDRIEIGAIKVAGNLAVVVTDASSIRFKRKARLLFSSISCAKMERGASPRAISRR